MNAEHDWLVWWHDEGSGMRPVNGQDHESHVRDMTRIAWLNGAFGAADEIERLRAERDEARRSCCEFAAMVDSADTVLMYVDSNRFHEIAMRYMKSRGWDCFKEEP